MRYPLAYLTGVFAALLVVPSFYAGGLWLLAMPVIIYLVLPVVDQLIGYSRWPSEHRVARFDAITERSYDRVMTLAAWSIIAFLAWALWAVSVTPLLWWEFAVFALVIGEFGGLIGIVTAHELMHRSSPGHKRIAFLLMALTGYAHYCIEHVRGHHKRVATPEDPATARAGETLYAFLPRSIIGGFRSAWQIEAKRLERAGQPLWSRHNAILVWHSFTIVLMIAITLLLGPLSLALFVIQASVAVLLLETVNYLQHYGLVRAKDATGRYERIRPEHSWNSSHLLTNVNLFNLGRHSDHHRESIRPYYKLRHYDDAPQMPFGYSAMVMLAMVPPLWFRVMDSRLDDYRRRRQTA
ncbi:alkane 1-monooxygenase [Sphingomicrobium clamense]|uniref:Alkane 1-monooxygenase n=1 Tax=Sphingomicrobium clamense TaxID=2851013 RepID=A0ABS6V653_9SPHN|nr:alkane 1-monooxygenase [Sphingomicrobium sp. B8]MBW0145045.1 alkane 1-monooxygenase [Sphingomicrobium sp. B8]